MKIPKHIILASALAGFCFNLNAASVVTVTGVTGHDGGNWPSTLGHLSDAVNANGSNDLGTADHNPGIDTSADLNDPSTWINSSTDWTTEWLGNSRLDSTSSLNSKIGWMAVDFGSVVADLENLYLWNGRNSPAEEKTRDFNVYYSSGVGIDALPAMPDSKSTTGDYNFGSGDWTQLGSTNTLAGPDSPYTPDATLALGGISAQYIGIEILSASGVLTPEDPTADRVGFGQLEVTAVPEPSSFALIGLAGMALLVRRRR